MSASLIGPSAHVHVKVDIGEGNCRDGLALLWQIFSGTGFPNQFFDDSWVVGFLEGRP